MAFSTRLLLLSAIFLPLAFFSGADADVSCYKVLSEANACTGEFCYNANCAGIPVNGCGHGPISMAEEQLRALCRPLGGYTEGSLKICLSNNCIAVGICDKITSVFSIPWY